MATVAGTTTIPIVIGLFVAVGLFFAWAAQVVHSQGAENAAPPQAAPVRQPRSVQPRSVQVVLGPHFTVAPPDDDAVRAAMSHRVRPPTPLPSPDRATTTHEEPAKVARLSRSA
jgi:hypothetical protein